MFLSVIIPVYNAEPYLRRCIDSVIAQDMRGEMEVLLIDDGSKDGSGTICDEYAKKHDWIRVFHIPNGGVGNARNYGLEQVKGDYFTFVDADDFMESGIYREVLILHQRHPADLYVFGYKDYPATENGIHMLKQQYCDNEESLADLYLRMKQDYLMFPVYNKIFKASENKSCRFMPSVHYYEDYLFVLDCLKSTRTACFVHQAAYNYVHHPGEHLGGAYTEPEIVVEVAGAIRKRSDLLPQNASLAKYTLLEYYNNLLQAIDNCRCLRERKKYIHFLLEEIRKYGHKSDFKRFLGRRKMLLLWPTDCGMLVMVYLRLLLLKLR